MTEKRFTLYKGLDTINIMDNTKFREQIYINKSSKDMKCLVGLLNELVEENKELKEENEYLCEKIKENEWHWNTIDEDRDVWRYKCKTLEEENEQLKCKVYSYKCSTETDKEIIEDLHKEYKVLEKKHKELQFQFNLLREQSNEFHRGARENANHVGQLERENKELKIKNDLLSDELEQAKAVINKKWNEYLKKKELSE